MGKQLAVIEDDFSDTTTALTVKVKSDFLAIQEGPGYFTDMLEELPPGRVPPLPRMGIPPGGGKAFSIMVGDDDVLFSGASIPAIGMFHAYTRHYYKQGYQESGGTAPDCWSPNRTQGYGDPGIECDNCPLGQWVRKGSGQNRVSIPPKCAATALLYLLTPHSPLPVRMRLSSTSASEFETFMLTLSGRKDKPKLWQLKLVLTLDSKERVGTKSKYSILHIENAGPLSQEERYALGGPDNPESLRKLFLPYFKNELDANRFLQRRADAENDASEADADDEGYEPIEEIAEEEIPL